MFFQRCIVYTRFCSIIIQWFVVRANVTCKKTIARVWDRISVPGRSMDRTMAYGLRTWLIRKIRSGRRSIVDDSRGMPGTKPKGKLTVDKVLRVDELFIYPESSSPTAPIVQIISMACNLRYPI